MFHDTIVATKRTSVGPIDGTSDFFLGTFAREDMIRIYPISEKIYPPNLGRECDFLWVERES